MNETIEWKTGIPPSDERFIVWMEPGSRTPMRSPPMTAAYYSFSAERWRDIKHELLNNVTHWAEIRGPQ